MNWPLHYPEQCPPTDAYKYQGRIFRFTNRTHASVKDFTSHYERKPNENWEDPCQARGLSVVNCLVGLKEMRKSVPALRRKKICEAVISTDEGVIADTPSNSSKRHKTWWLPMSLENPVEMFFSFDESELSDV